MVSLRFCIVAMCVWALACSSKSPSKKDDDEEARPTRLFGIDPLVYKCENLVTVDEVASALAGPVTAAEIAFEPPPGTAAPCHYLLSLDAGQQPWSFDMDCRNNALDTARKLFEQYQGTADKTDAGMSEVEVGKAAVDHHGQALLFIDDDTPCYVRVHGPTTEGRLSLGRLLAGKLTMDNAPMTPRPAQ
jgi:hypothetical protein